MPASRKDFVSLMDKVTAKFDEYLFYSKDKETYYLEVNDKKQSYLTVTLIPEFDQVYIVGYRYNQPVSTGYVRWVLSDLKETERNITVFVHNTLREF